MKIKKYLAIIILGSCLSMMVFGCDSMHNIFSRDLNVKMMVENASGLHEGSIVYLVQPDSLTQIGTVGKIKATDRRDSVLYLKIKRDFREKIRDGALFMVNRPLLSVDPPSIVIDVLPKSSQNPPMDSGTIVNETSYAKYGLQLARNAMEDTYDTVMKKTEQFFDDMEDYFNVDVLNELLEELKQLSEKINTFTVQQKEHFEKEVLPKIREKVDEAMRQFNDDSRYREKRNQLKEEMDHLENTLQT